MYFSFFGVTCCSLIVIGVQTATLPTLNQNPKLVVFSFDGFRYDYLDKYFGPNMELALAPTLRRLRSHGVTTPYMIPQFTTKTFPNHQSISTGLYTENHGIVDNSVYDLDLKRNLTGYDDERDFWVYNKEVLPVWVLNQMAGQGRISGAQFPGSTQIYGDGHVSIQYALGYDKSLPFKERMDYTVNWLTDAEYPANLVFMYFEEPDTQGHSFGPNSVQVKEAIENLDAMTAYFLGELDRLGIRDQVDIIFVSDHGMEEVKEKNKVSLVNLIDPALGYTLQGGSPLLHIWPEIEAETEKIYQAFLEASKTRPFNVFRKGNLPPYLHYDNDRRVSPVLIETYPGFSFDEKWEEDEEKHQRLSESANPIDPEAARGYHGYDIHAPNMRAFFVATGPSFAKGKQIDPFNNIDLFPLMCQLLQIPTPKHDGSLDHVTGALGTKASESSTLCGSQSMLVILMTTLCTQVISRVWS